MEMLIASYASYLKLERMRGASTVKRYVAVVEAFGSYIREHHGEDVPLEAVEKAHLIAFLRREAAETGEPSRAIWNTRLAALRSFYDFLFKQELVSLNPAQRVDRLKINPREPLPLSLDELLALVDAAEASPLRVRSRNVAIVHVLYHCAFRVSELVSLSLEQVDLENHIFINVRTKGNKRLSLPMSDLVACALERYLVDRPKLGASAGEPALLLSDRGTRLSVRAVQELVKAYAKRAGIARVVTPHLLRHSSATELAELGTPMRVVQEICGHSSVTTTERYIHVRGGARKVAIDALGAEIAKRLEERRKEAGMSQ